MKKRYICDQTKAPFFLWCSLINMLTPNTTLHTEYIFAHTYNYILHIIYPHDADQRIILSPSVYVHIHAHTHKYYVYMF